MVLRAEAGEVAEAYRPHRPADKAANHPVTPNATRHPLTVRHDRVVYQAITTVGLLLLATAGVIVLADTDDLSQRMPTQVPPRGFIRPLLVAGVVFLTIGVVGLLFA